MNEFLQKVLAQIIGALIVSSVIFVLTLPFKRTVEDLVELTQSIERNIAAATSAEK